MAATAIINQDGLYETGLFKVWSHETFNQLKDIDVSHKISLDDVVAQMGKYLREFGLNKHLGISRTHKHFQLNSNEVIQLSLGSSVDDPKAKVNSDANGAHLNPVKITGADAVLPIPYMWSYDKANKQFFPMQFFDGSNQTMQHRFNELCNEKRSQFLQFLHQFVRIVNETGTEDDLGFYIRYEDLMKLDQEKGEGLLEDTNVNSRRQWMTPKTKEMMEALVLEKQKTEVNLSIIIYNRHI
jgi:hypothetical protein